MLRSASHFRSLRCVALIRSKGARRAWMSAAAGAVIVASPFAYTWMRLGRISPMAEYAQLEWPSFNRLAAFVVEPNIGLVLSAPVYALALAMAAWSTLRLSAKRPPVHSARAPISGTGHQELAPPVQFWMPVIIQALLLVIWSQNPNINHGGTPGVNRWVLSLLALSLPWIGSMYLTMSKLSQRVVVTFVIVSAGWSASQHMPSRPEEYLRPTKVAEMMWRGGWLHATPAEVFAERSQHREPPLIPARYGGCDVVLISDLQWPLQCVPPDAEMPRQCRPPYSMCYAVAQGEATRILPTSFNGFFYSLAVPSWPATGPLASGVRALLRELDAGSREWAVEDARRWVEFAKDVEVAVVLRRDAAIFLHVARTGDDPELRLVAPGFAAASLHTLIPVSVLSRSAVSDARFVMRPRPRATNLAVTLVSSTTARLTP